MYWLGAFLSADAYNDKNIKLKWFQNKSTYSPASASFCLSLVFCLGRPGFILSGLVGVFPLPPPLPPVDIKWAKSSVCFNKKSNLFPRSETCEEIKGLGIYNSFPWSDTCEEMFYRITALQSCPEIQSPPKESIHFCRAEYSKLRGARWKVGGAPNLPLGWSKLGQTSFWNSNKWLHTNTTREEILFNQIAKLLKSHWLPCIWRKTGTFNLRNICF